MKYLPEESNFLAIEEEFSNYKESEIVVISAPFEKTVSYGHGTENGPAAILEASHYVEFYDDELDTELAFDKKISTLEPLSFEGLSIEDSLKKISDQVEEVLNDGKFAVILGGEHSISSACIKPFVKKYDNFSVLHFDAHSDLRAEYQGSIWSHASVMARVAEMTKNITQVGIRAQCKDEADFIKANGINTFYMRDIRIGKHGSNWKEKVVESLKDNVFISFDVDGLDPAIIPATGTPEPGGLQWDETLDLLKLVAQKKTIVGLDMVELAPVEANTISDFNTAKLTYKILNYAFMNK